MRGISVGISIGYYKYPLSALLEESGKQLFENAKNCEGKNSSSGLISGDIPVKV